MKGAKRAFVLAAGLGTRLRPLTLERAKPMFPVWGKPLLIHTLERLKLWGVEEVMINLHHRPGDVVDGLRRFPLPGLKVDFSFEPEILGTGGALVRAKGFVAEGPFWMVNGDVWMEVEPDGLVEGARGRKVIGSAWVTSEAGPRTVEVRRGMIENFRSSRPGSAGTATFCGVHLVRPEILEYLPRTGFSSIVDGYERAMGKGWRVAGREVPGSRWHDIGSPEQYLGLHREGTNAVKGFVAVEGCVDIGKGCGLKDVVIWSGAKLMPGTVLRDAIVGSGVVVPGGGGTDIFQQGETGLERVERRLVTEAGLNAGNVVMNVHPRRGSARRYTRLLDGRKRAILMAYDGRREENRLFVQHATFLSGIGVRVPRILAEDQAAERVVMEDVGDDSLERLFPGLSDSARRKFYGKTLEQVVRLHRDGLRGLNREGRVVMPGFDATLFGWEHTLFLQEALLPVLELAPKVVDALRGELARLATHLEGLPGVLLHRDLQSSNVHLYRGKVYLIDFQGMRRGPAAYDLASLVYDPYVAIEAELREDVVGMYRSELPQVSVRSIRRAGIQRLAQALGAYGRLSRISGQERFAAYAPVAAERLAGLVKEEGGLPELAAVLGDYRAHIKV
ncbi:MAG TPA: phosphotransferase [Kiritimatiellia bacterium]|nr:phosphotransferase [Kiritimatiellia bacterium]